MGSESRANAQKKNNKASYGVGPKFTIVQNPQLPHVLTDNQSIEAVVKHDFVKHDMT